MNNTIVIIVGPTAVGKTDISIEVAKKLKGEIISADSMQIYKHMNIGSAKLSPDEMQGINHYLIDEIDPRIKFSVAEYQELAKEYINRIFSKGKIPIIVGGTGLYVNSLMYRMNFSNTVSDYELRAKLESEGKEMGSKYLYDKLREVDIKAAERIHPNNIQKIIRALEIYYATGKNVKSFSNDLVETEDYNYVLIGLNRDRKELYDRVNLRVDIMLEQGLIDEVKNLKSSGLTEDDISMKGIGYKEVFGYLEGKYDFDETKRLIKRNTRRYAKRQLTWFNRYEKINWFTINNDTDKFKIINDIVKFIEGKIVFI